MLYQYKRFTFTIMISMILLVLVFSQSTSVYAANHENQYYQVKKGDTLYHIAIRYGITVKELMDNNGIRDPRLLQIGQRLTIKQHIQSGESMDQEPLEPVNTVSNGNNFLKSSHVYHVVSGDTLYEIAKAFGVSLKELIMDNQIRNPNLLQIGQKLKISTKENRMAVAVQSAESISVEGYSVERILNSTLTAYTAGYESTGKTSDHPAFGITFSGKRVQEGHTIAVDPKVIPLGTKVYIEGLGLREAQDVGSAIKGAKIDVYIEDLDEALRFGVKKNVKVYVLSN